LINSCTPITCSALAANGYGNQSVLAYTPTAGSGNIVCNQTGYSGNANYTCQAQGSATITKTCDCATGYVKNASGVCVFPSNNTFTPNWNAWTSIGCGSYISQSSNNMIEMIGPNGCGGQWSYFFTYLPAWATKVSFNWFYCTPDWNASYDPGKFYVNNTWYDIITSGYGYGSCYSGTFTNFAVQGGTAFGPGVYSTDGSYGGPNLKLYNIVVQ